MIKFILRAISIAISIVLIALCIWFMAPFLHYLIAVPIYMIFNGNTAPSVHITSSIIMFSYIFYISVKWIWQNWIKPGSYA